MPNGMASAHGDPSPDAPHAEWSRQLTLAPRCDVSGIGFAPQQAGHQQSQALLGFAVRLHGRMQRAHGLHAMVHASNASAQPVVLRSRLAQIWVEDDEPRAHAGVQKL